MKRNLLLLFLASAITFSCSSDKDEENDPVEEASLIGTWVLSEINVDDSSTNTNLNLAEDIINALIADGCDILTFTFSQDQTVVAESRDFTETGNDINPSGDGLLIECPENVEVDESVWSLDGDQLTFVDSDGLEETITINLEGNTLTIAGEAIDEDNLDDSDLIFTRE